MFQRAFRTKPLWAFQDEADASAAKIDAQFGFWSLLAIGVGGCVGSGVFVLSGTIAATTAGPATAISWIVAGLICALTALAYAELSSLLKSSGSAYSFAGYGLGEAFATIALYLITLEYGISGAAVARSWGDKLAYWFAVNDWVQSCDDVILSNATNPSCWVNAVGGSVFNPAAILISAIMLTIVLCGAKIEKTAVNVLVIFKVAIVAFIIIVGAIYTDVDNLSPFLPAPETAHDGGYLEGFVGGAQSIFLGATTGFFGFVGFDEVTVMAQEARNPNRDIPRTVLLTIAIVTFIYAAASIVLTGMMPYDLINQSEGFGSAFVYVGAEWAMQVTVAGEIFVILPTVVLLCYMPQARVFYAASCDGQLPKIFQRGRGKSNPFFWSALIAGTTCTLIAGVVPFDYLNDLISGGILLSFIMTNSSLLIVRSKRTATKPVVAMVIAMMICCFVYTKTNDVGNNIAAIIFVAFSGIGAIAILIFMACKFDFSVQQDTFQTPLTPLVPAFAIFFNWYLISQLSWTGLAMVVGLVALAVLNYVMYGSHRTIDYSLELEQEQEDGYKCHSHPGVETPEDMQVVVK